MAEKKIVTLPITGMTCANCVATVERNLKKQDGVEGAAVNLSSERASVTYNPELTGVPELIQRVERAGYGVASGEVVFPLLRLSDDNDARRLEKVLSSIEGVMRFRSILQQNQPVYSMYQPSLASRNSGKPSNSPVLKYPTHLLMPWTSKHKPDRKRLTCSAGC